ncbi:hypothetical protein GZ167_00380 [Staphylococcus aureus]|nr:hypothetical protein [Staphylococcus aureus]
MKKQIISLGALAVASSLFTWDNKADAIVTKDYSGKSQVNAGSKNGTLIDFSIKKKTEPTRRVVRSYAVFCLKKKT